MYMNEGMDTGDMILKEEVRIGEDETTGELWERLSKIGAKLLVETVEKIEDGTAPREKQPEDFTMAPMLHKEMANIDWDKKDATQIKNLVRGLNPIMGAYTYLNGKKIKFWKVEKLTTEELAQKYNEMNEYMDYIKKVQPGTVLFSNAKQGLYIKCNNDIISVIEIQGENSRKMNILDFLRGNSINAGEIFQNL